LGSNKNDILELSFPIYFFLSPWDITIYTFAITSYPCICSMEWYEKLHTTM